MTTNLTPEPEKQQHRQQSEPPPETPDEQPEELYNPGKEERTIAMLAHLLGGILCLTGGYLGFLAPLIIWLIKKDDMPFVDDQAKEALNFQLMILIAAFVALALSAITCGFGIILYIPLGLADVIFSIMAAVKANEGVTYRYPVNLRLVK